MRKGEVNDMEKKNMDINASTASLEKFREKVEILADEYANLLIKKIRGLDAEDKMDEINEGIRTLNHMSCTLGQIGRIQNDIVHGQNK